MLSVVSDHIEVQMDCLMQVPSQDQHVGVEAFVRDSEAEALNNCRSFG